MNGKIEIIRAYYKNPLRVCTISEVAKVLSRAYGTIYNYIQELIKNGVIHSESKGKSVLCSINLGSEESINLFSAYSLEQKSQFVSRYKLLSKALEELVNKILNVTDHKIYSVVVFGSIVKGTESKKSDIDLLILSPSKEDLDESIETECIVLHRSYGFEVNPIIAEPQMYLKMIRDKEHNVGKEIIKNKIIFYGPEKYWRLTFEGLK